MEVNIPDVDSIMRAYDASFTGTGIIPIPHQHCGNCASDTIQIIMFFADGYWQHFLDFATKLIRAGDVSLTVDQTNDYIFMYILNAIRRFVSLYNRQSAGKPVGSKYTTLTRLPSMRGIHDTKNMGITCSMCIALYMNPRKEPSVPDSWAYIQPKYMEFTTKILNYGPPPFYTATLYNNQLPINIETKDNIVAVQFHCFQGGRGPSYSEHVGVFHTFCAFRHNGVWYIGDNMVGLAIPLSLAIPISPNTSTKVFTIIDIANSTISYASTPVIETPHHYNFFYKFTIGEMAWNIAIARIYIPESAGVYSGIFEENKFMRVYYYAMPVTMKGGGRKQYYKKNKSRKLRRKYKHK
jgi:hypothetical protein